MKIPPGLTIKEQHRWIWLLLYALGVMAALTACGGSGGGPVPGSDDQAVSAAAGPARGAGVLVAEAEIATLPDWQQGLLNDPGWNQPYIAPRVATEVPEPTWEMLREYLDAEAGKVNSIRPRLADQRSASWMELSAFQPQELTLQGEYDGVPKTAKPVYGCNNDGSNGTEEGNAFEDVIRAGTRYQPQALEAVIADLDCLGAAYTEVDYSPTVAADLDILDLISVIWVWGGPGAFDEPVATNEWTSEEIDNLIALLDNGVDVLLMSQDHGWNSEEYPGYGWGTYYGWDENLLAQSIPTGEEWFLWALGMTEAAGIGMSGNYGFLMSSPRNLAVA